MKFGFQKSIFRHGLRFFESLSKFSKNAKYGNSDWSVTLNAHSKLALAPSSHGRLVNDDSSFHICKQTNLHFSRIFQLHFFEFRAKKMNFWTTFTFWIVLAIHLTLCFCNSSSNNGKNSRSSIRIVHVHAERKFFFFYIQI